MYGNGRHSASRNVLCVRVYTVEPPITDPPRYGHPPYNGRMVGTDRYSHINSAFLPSEIRTSLTDKPLNYGRRTCSETAITITNSPLTGGQPKPRPQILL